MLRALIALACAGAAVAAAGDTIPPSALGPRTVRFTYDARVVIPPGTHVLELWMPLPREEDQDVLELGFSGSATPTVVRLPGGDRAAYVRVADPSTPVSLSETGTVARREVRAPLGRGRQPASRVDPVAYASELGTTPSIAIDDQVRSIARRTAGTQSTVVAQARAIYDWVYDHMQYDKSVPGWGLGDIPYCLKVGKGNCTDFHSLFIGLARTSGIPARWSIGFPVAYDAHDDGGDPQDVKGYHCWAEFYAPGAGWVPVDISEARKHPELKDYFFGSLSGNRILFTRLRDGLLEPDGTGRRLNYFIYPVARADGTDVPDIEWTFRYRDVPN